MPGHLFDQDTLVESFERLDELQRTGGFCRHQRFADLDNLEFQNQLIWRHGRVQVNYFFLYGSAYGSCCQADCFSPWK